MVDERCRMKLDAEKLREVYPETYFMLESYLSGREDGTDWYPLTRSQGTSCSGVPWTTMTR